MTTRDLLSEAEHTLAARFQDRLIVNEDLHRRMVSFQANKQQQGYRWFHYREGFSAQLVEYLLQHFHITSGQLLDPFAGSGTALFAASRQGLDALGIELLPVGCEIIQHRQHVLGAMGPKMLQVLDRWVRQKPWTDADIRVPFPHLRITRGAFPTENEIALEKYLAILEQEDEAAIRSLLRFAAMCILEEISYTRKDGQYLRWDHRSGRQQGTRQFHKGQILSFDDAIQRKLSQMGDDMRYEIATSQATITPGQIALWPGSCLTHLPRLPSRSIDCIITSPPYCNRYDYTRTYALELALLSINDENLKRMRQAMISCTVENKVKEDLYHCLDKALLDRARTCLHHQTWLPLFLNYLEEGRAKGLLNNAAIPRMVRNYFWEMTLVLLECSRILKPGALFVMINDNVRYAGVRVPVDLLLSDLAQQAGLSVEMIWVLPSGKGNSSQQMGRHGREELRKSVYVWRAP